MTIQLTTWKSGICKCELQFKWDDAVSSENRVHVFEKSINTCAEHAAHKDLPSHLSTLKEEHKLVSYTMISVANELGIDISSDKVKPEINRQFIKDCKWSFDKDRNLVISHPDLDSVKKISLLSKLNAKNGTGKVKIGS
jgi:hypothetical protein